MNLIWTFLTHLHYGDCRSSSEGWGWRHPSGDVYEQGWQNLQHPTTWSSVRQTLWGCLLSRRWDLFYTIWLMCQSKGLFCPREINNIIKYCRYKEERISGSARWNVHLQVAVEGGTIWKWPTLYFLPVLLLQWSSQRHQLWSHRPPAGV